MSALGRNAMLAGALALAGAGAAAQDRPYTVREGKADRNTVAGYVRFHAVCVECHGPGGRGTALAPTLMRPMKTMTRDQFADLVAKGRERMVGSVLMVMPPFADDPEVMGALDALYAYLKARADGALALDRPGALP